MSRPLPLTVLGSLQFAGFAIAVVVLLGDGTLDGALSGADVARAVGLALLGAVVVGSTWSGARLAWWFELALAAGAVAWGAVTTASDDPPGYPVLAAGAIWLALLTMPSSRSWFLRPVVE